MDLIYTLWKMLDNLPGPAERQTALVLLSKDHYMAVRYSWEEYLANALAIARALQKSNLIKPGQENFFAVIGLNRPESFFALLGIIMAGGVPVPINVPLLKEQPEQLELEAILANCQPLKVLASQELICHLAKIDDHRPVKSFEELLYAGGSQRESQTAEPARWLPPKTPHGVLLEIELLPHRNSSDLLIMPYTSGRTGEPKGVMLSSNNVLDRVSAITETLAVTPQDHVLSYLSLGHISDLISTFFSQLRVGYSVFFTDHAYDIVFNREKFKSEFPAVLQAVRPTLFLAVPKIWKNIQREIDKQLPKHIPTKWLRGQVVRHKLGLDQTRHFISAGAALDHETINFFEGLKMPILDIYGQTETAGPLLLDGQVIGDASVSISPVNGEIEVSGACVMQGYYRNPSATALALERLSTHPSSPFFLKTGDKGEYFTPSDTLERYLRIAIKGSLNDGFKLSNAEYVKPEIIFDMEQTLRQIEGVEEAVVCGEGKDYLVAIIFTENNALKPDENTALKEKITLTLSQIGEGFHRVKNFAILDKKEIVTTPTGKTKRMAIIKKFKDIIKEL